MSVRLYQGALSGKGKKHSATDNAVCAEQFVDGQRYAYAKCHGMNAPAMRVRAQKRLEMAAHQQQYASKFFETEIRVSLVGF